MDVLKFVDYNIIISLGFVSKTFHYVVLGNLAALPTRRSFTLTLANDRLAVLDEQGDEVVSSACTAYTLMFVVSVERLAHHIGPHAVARLIFRDGTCLPFSAR